MRRLLVVALLACGDKRQAEPVAPPGGSQVLTPDAAVDAAALEPSRISLRAGGKPPVRTTQPVSRAQLADLAALAIPDLTARVRKLDDGFLDVEYTLATPPVTIDVTVQPCLRCVPMQLDRWRAETDALRVTIPPELRERESTTFEVAQLALGGAPVIATYQLAPAPQFDQATAVYFNDGQNQVRVIARCTTGEAITRRELDQLAVAVLDRLVQAW